MDDGTTYVATAGTVGINANEAYSEITVSLTDVSAAAGSGESIALDGSITTGLLVSCETRVDEGPGCVWIQEPAPYTSAYCIGVTAGYPDSSFY